MKQPLEECPPKPYLKQILKNCPKAGLTYMDLWERRDVDNEIIIRFKDVKLEYLTSLAKFRHDLLLIVKEGLANVRESKTSIMIELVDYDLNGEVPLPC